MVVGNGLIARVFSKYIDDDRFTIFASGVSNSKELDVKEFEREEHMLTDSILKNGKNRFVYFSTCSIDDKSLVDSMYITHKKNMESIIKSKCQNYIIFRLPNVVGKTENKNTFFNYFKNKISNQEEIHIDENAFRYIIDVDDLGKFLPSLIEFELNTEVTKSINVAMDNKSSVKDICFLMEDIMSKKTDKIFLDKGVEYTIDNEIFIEHLKQFGLLDFTNYNKEVLSKYLS